MWLDFKGCDCNHDFHCNPFQLVMRDFISQSVVMTTTSQWYPYQQGFKPSKNKKKTKNNRTHGGQKSTQWAASRMWFSSMMEHPQLNVVPSYTISAHYKMHNRVFSKYFFVIGAIFFQKWFGKSNLPRCIVVVLVVVVVVIFLQILWGHWYTCFGLLVTLCC